VNGIGSSGSIKGGKFLDEVSHYKLLNDCVVSSLGISRQVYLASLLDVCWLLPESSGG
jgi:hypothetical protein